MTTSATAEFDPGIPIVDAVREGDRRAFEDLVRENDRWVRGVVFGVLGDPDLTDDVTQHVWVAVWSRVAELRDVRAWRPWLYRLARNAAIDAERTRRRRRHSHTAVSERSAEPSPAPGQALSRRERQAAVLEAIQALPALYREPFVLRHVQDWSYRQIAETMGCPVDTVETRLVRARRQLRSALKGKV
jgi:RNA polymerase sigma-70 factor (ECF subfamily)